MAKRGPKPKAKSTAKKRDYAAERRKAAANKAAAIVPPWLTEYIARINDSLPSLEREERELDCAIPEAREERLQQWTDLETIVRIDAYAEETLRLELADNAVAYFSPTHTGHPRGVETKDAVTTIHLLSPPELLHQNWVKKMKPDVLTWINIQTLLKPETKDALLLSNAYFNLVAEASKYGRKKRQPPKKVFMPLPSNRKRGKP